MTASDDPAETAPDPLVAHILASVADGPREPAEIAKAFFEARRKPKDPPDGWRRYLAPVKQVSLKLAREGRLEYERRGEAVPVEEARGLVKLRLPRG